MVVMCVEGAFSTSKMKKSQYVVASLEAKLTKHKKANNGLAEKNKKLTEEVTTLKDTRANEKKALEDENSSLKAVAAP